MPFTQPIQIEETSPGRYVLVRQAVYQGNRDQITIPAGFPTDLASIPKPFHWMATPAHWLAPAVLHDWLWQANREGYGYDPVDTDGMFRRALREQGVGPVQRWLAYLAVRMAATFAGRLGEWSYPRVIAAGVAAGVLTLVMIPPALLPVLYMAGIKLVNMVASRLIVGAPNQTR